MTEIIALVGGAVETAEPTVKPPGLDVNEVRVADNVGPVEDANHAIDVRTADGEAATPTHYSAVEAALEDSVTKAMERAETQLTDLIDRIRKESAAQHRAELARAIEAAEQRQEQAVREAREAMEAEAIRASEEIELRHEKELQRLVAAVERVLKEKDGRHAEELKRVKAELGAQQVANLQRINDAVLESVEALTARIVRTA